MLEIIIGECGFCRFPTAILKREKKICCMNTECQAYSPNVKDLFLIDAIQKLTSAIKEIKNDAGDIEKQ